MSYIPAGQCRCGWDFNLHPFDAEGVDVGRCPTEAESKVLEEHPAWNELMATVRTFPVHPSSADHLCQYRHRSWSKPCGRSPEDPAHYTLNGELRPPYAAYTGPVRHPFNASERWDPWIGDPIRRVTPEKLRAVK